MIARRTLLRLLSWLAVASAGTAAAPAQVRFDRTELVIVSATGRHLFHVEVARTQAQMERGLMFRTRLAPDAGMLFQFPAPTMAQFWMHNTLIPLDMLFVDEKGRIVNIAARAQPMSDAVISAAALVVGVVEVNGGTAARLGIAPGDRVQGAFFGTAR